jgi:apolipoprotein N-acyltransferase
MKRNFSLVFLTGILIALSLPPFKTGFLAYGALVPFFLLLKDKRGFEAFRWSYLTGFVVFAFTLYWLWGVTKAGFLGALLVLPLYFNLYAFFHTTLLKRFGKWAFALFPFLWTSVEYLQSIGETAFPWVYLGYSQSYYLPLVQYAEYTGVYGISFWIVCINVLIYLLWQYRNVPIRKIVISSTLLVLFIVPAAFGLYVLREKPKGETLKIALIQGSIDPYEKWDPQYVNRNFDLYIEKTKEQMAQNPDLVIWPETATGTWLRYERKYRDIIHFMVDSSRIPLLTGSIDYTFNDQTHYDHFNSAFLFEPHSSRIQHYQKRQLVPFSERVPYSQILPIGIFRDFLSDMELGVGSYVRGKEYNLLKIYQNKEYDTLSANRNDDKKYFFAVPICYESVFPNLLRKFVKNGANFLAIITNDAWFGKTSAPYQHAQIAAIRAIENRISIARCANTGISCFIGPYGRVSQTTQLFVKDAQIGEIGLRSTTTFYTKYGNVFAIFVSFVTTMGLIVRLILPRKLKKKVS